MTEPNYAVVVSAGSLRPVSGIGVAMAHRWTAEGVIVESAFTGAHLLHLAAAGCVLNDVYREAQQLGIDVAGVRVTASGGFDSTTWESSGIVYSVELDTDAEAASSARLLAVVDEVAEIPRALRVGTTVQRQRLAR